MILKTFGSFWISLASFGYVLSQDLMQVNAAIAHAAVTDKLSANPFLQGILLKGVTKLDRQQRGIETNRGRAPQMSECATNLIQDAALTLAIAGGNKMLMRELGQNQTAPRILTEDLPSWSLPNPCLALMSNFRDRLLENLDLVDKQFPRAPSAPTQRLVVAMDATYLQKAVQQMMVRDVPGLVGAPWSPNDETFGFIPLNRVPDETPYAACIVDFLAFDPCARHRRDFSIASMPMGLAPTLSENMSKTHAGNMDTS